MFAGSGKGARVEGSNGSGSTDSPELRLKNNTIKYKCECFHLMLYVTVENKDKKSCCYGFITLAREECTGQLSLRSRQ